MLWVLIDFMATKEEIIKLISQAEKLDMDNPTWAKPGVCFIAGKNDISEIGIWQPEKREDMKNGINFIACKFYRKESTGQIKDGVMLTPNFDSKPLNDTPLKGETVLGDYLSYLFHMGAYDYAINTPETFHDYVRESLNAKDWELIEPEGTNPDYRLSKDQKDAENYLSLIESCLKCKVNTAKGK